MTRQGNDSPGTIDGWSCYQGRKEEADYGGEATSHD
jgi:hypothetical protein